MTNINILDQITKLDKGALSKWGAHEFTINLSGESIKFNTVADKTVYVKYDDDQYSYDIDFIKDWEIKKSIKGLYFDQLIDTIDNEIL